MTVHDGNPHEMVKFDLFEMKIVNVVSVTTIEAVVVDIMLVMTAISEHFPAVYNFPSNHQ